MCTQCGVFFQVARDEDGRNNPFTVIKHSGASIVYLDRFKTELQARKFAAKAHNDRLRQTKADKYKGRAQR